MIKIGVLTRAIIFLIEKKIIYNLILYFVHLLHFIVLRVVCHILKHYTQYNLQVITFQINLFGKLNF